MPLELERIGYATAYASLPVGAFNAEARTIKRKVRRWRDAWSKAHPDLDLPVSEPDIIYLLGQADLAAQIRVSDFRKVFDIGYPAGDCLSTTVNWVFSVAYKLPRLNFRMRAGDEFQYVLHLRYRRSIFAYPNSEEEIIRTIIELAHAGKLVASVQAGMGWSDLIIEGTFSNESLDDLWKFIISVHGIHLMVAAEEHPVFDRMLTIVGYGGDVPPNFEHGHMMFVRAVPGRYDEIFAKLKPLGDVHILDGKADFVAGREKTRTDFLKEQRKLTGKQGRGVFEKIDTHLMYAPAAKYTRVADKEAMLANIFDERLHHPCGCRVKAHEHYLSLTKQLKTFDAALLPPGHRYSVENILFLLGGALKDPSGCCDIRDAVFACYDGLETILNGLKEKAEERLAVALIDERGITPFQAAARQEEAENAARRVHQEEIVAFYQRIDEWHRFAEVLLRQRTVGSFEEILGHTDRAVVYSGGVQKFLFLADRLVNDFAWKIDRQLPWFATIYDSVKTIVSHSGLGLIHIPTRNIFQLPLAVAGLWHEVGSVLFKEVELGTVPLPPDRTVRRELIALLSDCFGDIVVYLFGFAGDVEKFIASLAWATKETYGTKKPEAGSHVIGQFLMRVYLVYEFHKIRELLQSRKGHALITDDEEAIRSQVADWIGELKSFWDHNYGPSPHYAMLQIPQMHWVQLYKNAINENFGVYFRSLYARYAGHYVDPARPSVTPFENGAIQPITPNHDLNAYFGEMAYMVQAPDAVKMNYFLMMATLGKSATIEYHRRRATGQN